MAFNHLAEVNLRLLWPLVIFADRIDSIISLVAPLFGIVKRAALSKVYLQPIVDPQARADINLLVINTMHLTLKDRMHIQSPIADNLK